MSHVAGGARLTAIRLLQIYHGVRGIGLSLPAETGTLEDVMRHRQLPAFSAFFSRLVRAMGEEGSADGFERMVTVADNLSASVPNVSSIGSALAADFHRGIERQNAAAGSWFGTAQLETNKVARMPALVAQTAELELLSTGLKRLAEHNAAERVAAKLRGSGAYGGGGQVALGGGAQGGPFVGPPPPPMSVPPAPRWPTSPPAGPAGGGVRRAPSDGGCPRPRPPSAGRGRAGAHLRLPD